MFKSRQCLQCHFTEIRYESFSQQIMKIVSVLDKTSLHCACFKPTEGVIALLSSDREIIETKLVGPFSEISIFPNRDDVINETMKTEIYVNFLIRQSN